MKNKLTRLSLLLLVGIVAFAGVILVENPFAAKASSPISVLRAPLAQVSTSSTISTTVTTSSHTSSTTTVSQSSTTTAHDHHDDHRTNSTSFGSPDD